MSAGTYLAAAAVALAASLATLVSFNSMTFIHSTFCNSYEAAIEASLAASF